MTSVIKFVLTIAVLVFANVGHAENQNLAYEEANDQPFMQLISEFYAEDIHATLDAGRCNGSYDCSWPTTQCKNNRCVKPNGDSGQCNGGYDCSWPTTQCRNGACVKPNGDGGECTGSYDCKWPYSRCTNGFCERP